MFTHHIIHKLDRPLWISAILRDHGHRPSCDPGDRNLRIITIDIARSVHCNIDTLRIILIEDLLLVGKVCPLIKHTKISSVRNFFTCLDAGIDKNIGSKISFLAKPPEHFHPGKIFRICITVIILSILFTRNCQKVLQILIERYTSGLGKHMRTNRYQWLSIYLREHSGGIYDCLIEALLRRHIRASDCLIDILPHQKSLVCGNIVVLLQILRCIAGVRITVDISVWLCIPVDDRLVTNLVKQRIIFVCQFI